MGWDFIQGATREAVIRERTASSVAHRVVRSVLWVVHEEAGERWIECNLLHTDRRLGAGYKAMDERSHPYEYSCPLELLALAPVACEEWRAKVAEYHARQARALSVGDLVTLEEGCSPRRLRVSSLRPLRGVDPDTEREYRLPKRLVLSVA